MTTFEERYPSISPERLAQIRAAAYRAADQLPPPTDEQRERIRQILRSSRLNIRS